MTACMIEDKKAEETEWQCLDGVKKLSSEGGEEQTYFGDRRGLCILLPVQLAAPFRCPPPPY